MPVDKQKTAGGDQGHYHTVLCARHTLFTNAGNPVRFALVV